MTAYFSTINDSENAVKLLLDFHKQSDMPFKTSAAWALALFKTCLNDKDKVAISKDGGILLGAISNSILGPFKQAHEIVWWVDPNKRGNSMDMIKLYENWAKENGAKLIELKSLEKFKDTEIIYNKIGYKIIEKSWIKVV